MARFPGICGLAGAVTLAGCAAILGVDKDYEDVGDAAAAPDVVDGATSPGNDAGDANVPLDASVDADADARVDAPVDGPPYAPLATGDIRLYYARNGGDLWSRTWSHAGLAWAVPVQIATEPAPRVPWIVPAIAPSGGGRA